MKTASINLDVVENVPPSAEAQRRLKRLRALAWFLDRSFSAGGGRRFGLDPLIGLIPGIGDWIAAAFSLYVIYEAARLGLRWAILARMTGNILIEAIVGAVPVAGDVFDFVWQANTRNIRLVEAHYQPSLPTRPLGRIAGGLIALALLLLILLVAITVVFVQAIWNVIAGLGA